MIKKKKRKDVLSPQQWVMRCLNHSSGLIVAWASDNEDCPLCEMYKANKRLQKRIERLKEKLKKAKKGLPKKKKKRKKKDDLAF